MNEYLEIYTGCTWCDTIFESHPIHEGKPCSWKPQGCNCAREDPAKADAMVEENIKQLRKEYPSL